MNAEKIRETLRARPFRRFYLCLADGRQIRVIHPELVALSASGRSATVFGPRDELEIVDVPLVTGVSFRKPKVKPTKHGN